MKSSTLLLAAALCATVAALPRFWGGRSREGFVRMHLDDERGHRNVHDSRLETSVTGTATIDQKIDHFNSADTRTFKQRYFYRYDNNQAVKKVNFLYLSGEQTASDKMISGDDKPIVKYASKFAANLYALEHRFYGKSRPFTDTATENLKYLSSRQAIEDIAEFIKKQNAVSGSDNKWVIVGGSYAGALSAWARLKHPELIAGSIASSAPILAQLDFYGYLQTVQNNVAKYPDCYDKLKDGINQIIEKFESSQGRDDLDKKFPVSPKLKSYGDLQDNDIVNFFTYVTDAFEGSSQYGGQGSGAGYTLTVKELCDKFTGNDVAKDPVQGLADIVKLYTVDPGQTFNTNYTADIEDLSNVQYCDPDLGDKECEETDFTGRLWTWQTCTEFGYFQSTDYGSSQTSASKPTDPNQKPFINSNIFQSTVPVNIYVDQCQDVFGLDIGAIRKSIDATNDYYGERDYFTGTNVVFAHGSVDPWSYLTKQLGTEKHWSVITVELEGGTHCSDLNPVCNSKNVCDDERKRVQELTQQQIDQWLNGPFPVQDSINITDNVGKKPIWYDQSVSSPLSITQNGAGDGVANRAKRSAVERRTRNRTGRRWNPFTGKDSRYALPPAQEIMRPDLPVGTTEGKVPQPWDHFNPYNTSTFQQRFFMNDIYVKRDANGNKVKDAPNFLKIGGESPASDDWVTNEGYAWMTYAKDVGANVYLLEHRYYGESKLTGTLDFQYLTSAQMLYDVAQFIEIVKRDGQTGPWITFGGSYAGALAAWAREWFPELILGAVGSSGPVLAKNDFYEYMQVVEKVLRAKDEKCATRTQEAFDSLRKMVREPSSRKQISDKFNLDPKWTNPGTVPAINIQFVISNLYGYFQDIVQYSDDNNVKGRDYTVRELCEIMTDEVKYPDPLDAVRKVQQWKEDNSDNPTTQSDPEDYFTELRDKANHIGGQLEPDGTIYWQDKDLADVLWTWQTCNEFGYYQTTDYGYGIFGNPTSLNLYATMCERVFKDWKMDHIEKGVARTNYQYGGRSRYSATNVVLPNGNHDPWHALSITEQGNQDKSVVPILIDGTAHCADMYPERDSDSDQLKQARKTILANIKSWLNGSPVDTPTVPTQTPPPAPTTTTSASGLSTIVAVLAPIVAILVL